MAQVRAFYHPAKLAPLDLSRTDSADTSRMGTTTSINFWEVIGYYYQLAGFHR